MSARNWMAGGAVVLFLALAAALQARAPGERPLQIGPLDPAERPAAMLPDLAASAKAARRAEETIRQKMQTRITREIDETPLDEVLQMLAEQGGFAYWIDSDTLVAECGVGASDLLVTEYLRDITVEQALNRIVRPFDLDWLIDNEVLKITAQIQAEELLTTRVYDVRKLVRLQEKAAAGRREARAPDGSHFRIAPETLEPAPRTIQAQFGTGMGVMGCIRGRSCTPCPCSGCSGSAHPKFHWLIVTVEQHTSGPWEDINGEGGTLSLMGHLLVVRQTQRVQDEVAGLLEALETAAEGRLAYGAMAVRPPHYPFVADAAIHGALGRRIRPAWKDRLLSSIAADLEETLGITVLIQVIEVEQELGDRDLPATLQTEEITAHAALMLLLEPLQLAYYVEDGALWITTQLAAEDHRRGRRLYAVVHDVGDLAQSGHSGEKLIASMMDGTRGPWMERDGEGGRASEPLPGVLVISHTYHMHRELALLLDDLRRGNERPADPPGPDQSEVLTRFYPAGTRERAEDLAQALTTLVAPRSWATGGPGQIRIVGRTLAIRQTNGIHAEIDRFIEALSQAEPRD